MKFSTFCTSTKSNISILKFWQIYMTIARNAKIILVKCHDVWSRLGFEQCYDVTKFIRLKKECNWPSIVITVLFDIQHALRLVRHGLCIANLIGTYEIEGWLVVTWKIFLPCIIDQPVMHIWSLMFMLGVWLFDTSISLGCTVVGLYQRKGKIIFLGLDNAGKTTLLSVLKEGHLTQPVPTLHPSKWAWTAVSRNELNALI